MKEYGYLIASIICLGTVSMVGCSKNVNSIEEKSEMTMDDEINIEEIEVPLYRKLIVIKGNYETIKNELTKIEDKNSWIEVHISDDNAMYANNEIRQLASKLELTLLAVKIDKSEKQLKANDLKVISLDELSVEQVFEKRLELENLEDKEFEKELLLNFKEVVSKVQSL